MTLNLFKILPATACSSLPPYISTPSGFAVYSSRMASCLLYGFNTARFWDYAEPDFRWPFGHLDYQQDAAVVRRAEMSLKLFLTPPEFLDHYPVLFLNVTIDPTADASGFNLSSLSNGAKDFQCFPCFFGRYVHPDGRVNHEPNPFLLLIQCRFVPGTGTETKIIRPATLSIKRKICQATL